MKQLIRFALFQVGRFTGGGFFARRGSLWHTFLAWVYECEGTVVS